MKSRTTLLLSGGILALSLAGCTAMSPPAPPPAYEGTDSVGAVRASMIVGTWQGRALNPREGTPSNPYTVTFSADGKMVYQIDDTQSGLAMKLQGIGNWQVNGEEITTQIESFKETSGNTIAGFVARFMTSLKDSLSGSANVYEASANRVVLVNKEGGAVELTRMQ